jgi:predicted translin family RNA/ssDNA-binding protein
LEGIVTDEEYVGGACIGLSQDLARYAIGRATARDVTSVQLAHDVVQSIFELLLQFDFRNGPLRRKYDGTKYALKTLETTLYELSITGGGSTADNDTIEEPESKRPRTENDTETVEADARIPTTEINELRKRMEHRDELRERLIKKSRDGQKAAKQAIFALHRSDVKRAGDLIADCEKCIQTDLYPIVMEEPNLRYGCFANVLEEYAEAKLFYAWLHGEGELSDASSSSPVGLLLRPDQFSCVTLEPADYLGGLCDLTGEIGRFAVQRGAARDSNGVRQCLEANMSILASLQMMEREPQEISKKMDQLRRSVQKLERMLYEISLVEATGGTRKVETSNNEQDEDN